MEFQNKTFGVYKIWWLSTSIYDNPLVTGPLHSDTYLQSTVWLFVLGLHTADVSMRLDDNTAFKNLPWRLSYCNQVSHIPTT